METEVLMGIALTLANEELKYLSDGYPVGWGAGDAIGDVRRDLREICLAIANGPFLTIPEFSAELWKHCYNENKLAADFERLIKE